jgi:hypothetical protein
MAASTASRPLTPLLYRSGGRRRSNAVVIVAAASSPDAEPAAAQGKKKTVDTRIHWSDPDEGWVGAKANKEGDGDSRRGKNEPLGGRFSDFINAASESHYQLSPFPIHAPSIPS